MSYVGDPFEHDVFVSYSHGDPGGSGESKIKQWSQAFVQELESELRAHPQMGSSIKVFLDQHHRPDQSVDPMEGLTGQLQTEIGRAALLAVLMSPHYLRSGWCRDERMWWFEEQSKSGLPMEGRVAVVRIWPTDEAWPKELTDSSGVQIPGFFFYDRARAERHPQPYEWPSPTSTSQGVFREMLIDLVGRLWQKMGALRSHLDGRRRKEADTAKLSAAGGQVVYLHGRADTREAWERAFDALGDAGLAVMPSEPEPAADDPKELQEIRRTRVKTMSGCDALLLVAPPAGPAVDADLVVIGRQDRYSARAISEKLLPCALLDTAGPAIATPRRRSAAMRLGVEWIDASGAAWTPAVQQWLAAAATAHPTGERFHANP